jgi:large-conductance mechanosensitive channel
MEYNYPVLIVGVILIIIVLGSIFMIFRGIVIWYLKIDIKIKNQEKQNELLEEIRDSLKREKPTI